MKFHLKFNSFHLRQLILKWLNGSILNLMRIPFCSHANCNQVMFKKGLHIICAKHDAVI